MKKIFVVIGKLLLLVAAVVGIACIGMVNEWNDATILGAFLFGGVIVALMLGLFDIHVSDKHLSIKQGARSMRRAA